MNAGTLLGVLAAADAIIEMLQRAGINYGEVRAVQEQRAAEGATFSAADAARFIDEAREKVEAM